MSKNRGNTWLAVIGVAAGVVVTAGLGMFTFIQSLSTPLHPNASEVPSATEAVPAATWAPRVQKAREAALAGLVEQNLPALSVAVGAGGHFVWSEAFGWADLEKRRAATPRTRFRIGHVSKAVTSAGVGRLLENDRLRLDARIQTYVPAFPEKAWPLTLRHLMAHTGGVRHYRSEEDYSPSSHCDRAADAVAGFAGDPLLFEPGTRYQYSTYGWILVSAAIEAVAGEPFAAFMRREVFGPAGMKGTTFDESPDAAADRVTFYYPRFSGDPATGSEPARTVDYSCFAGAGALLSTPSDLVHFGLALESGKLLKRSTVATLQMPQLLASGQETEYGLGWMLHDVTLAGEPAREAGHASLTLLGGSTSFLMFPERGIVVAVMSNASRASTRSIALRIAEVFAAR